VTDVTDLRRGARDHAFSVRLTNFEGPFDLLLQLISKHKLEVTEVALSMVTDEFIDHIKAQGPGWDLDQASQFLVVAATLLDLKAARLLPQGEVEDAEDLDFLEARDLLFARLLQYRAFRQVAAWIETTLGDQALRFARPGGLEEQFARLLPEVRLGLTPAELAAVAARAMQPRAVVEVSVTHLHQARVSVAEQAQVVTDRLSSVMGRSPSVPSSPTLPTRFTPSPGSCRCWSSSAAAGWRSTRSRHSASCCCGGRATPSPTWQ
jgi:segregation and condensation protein A